MPPIPAATTTTTMRIDRFIPTHVYAIWQPGDSNLLLLFKKSIITGRYPFGHFITPGKPPFAPPKGLMEAGRR
jgi:hypothetical protein